jgi:hypothetical protein
LWGYISAPEVGVKLGRRDNMDKVRQKSIDQEKQRNNMIEKEATKEINTS